MRELWRFLQYSSKPVFTGRELKEAVGEELARIAWRELLVEEVSYSDGEMRRRGVLLDSAMLRFSIERLLELLRRCLGAEPTNVTTLGYGPVLDIAAVGNMAVGAERADVFLVLRPLSESFQWFEQLRRVTPARTIILVPTADGLPARMHHLQQASGPLEFRFLDEILCVRNDQIVAVARRSTTCPGPYCFITDVAGQRQIDKPEYHATLASADRFDLLIDITTTRVAGFYRAFASANGVPWFTDLSWSQAAVLIELGRAGRPMRADELRSIDVEHPDKLIERARSEVDIEVGWRSWRAFKTLPGESRRDKRYHFDPPPGFRFAFLYI